MKHFSPNSQKVLVVTGCDLSDSNNNDEISDEMINIAMRDLKLEAAYKVSAKTGENVEEMFEDIARRVKVKPVKRVNFCKPLWFVVSLNTIWLTDDLINANQCQIAALSLWLSIYNQVSQSVSQSVATQSSLVRIS